MALRRSAAGGGRILHPFDVLVAVRTPSPTLPRKGRAIAYGIFNESSLRTQGPQRERKLRSSRRRGLSFLHWSRGLLSLLRPGVMGPCVRRDDPPRDCAKPRHRLKLVICDSPARKRERGQAVRYRASRAERHKIYTTKIQRTQRAAATPPSCTQWNRNQTPSVPAFAAA